MNNNRKKLVFILLTVFVFLSCNKSEKENDLLADYLGQKPPGDVPVRFAPGIVATINHEHSRIEFSPDGLEIYWAIIPVDTSIGEGGSPFILEEQKIWYSIKTSPGWSEAQVFAPNIETGGISPEFSPEGKILYYLSADPGADPDARPIPKLLYSAHKVEGVYINRGTVDDILPKVDNTFTMSFCFAENGNLYFDAGSPEEDGWTWNIYKSEYKEGGYSQPVKLASGINEGEVDWCPWIAPDESYLIWSSHREGMIGRGDLYISFKNEDGFWSTPINMGEKINTEKQERFPSVSPDGRYLFFARHELETYSDIFWVDAEAINELKINNSLGMK